MNNVKKFLAKSALSLGLLLGKPALAQEKGAYGFATAGMDFLLEPGRAKVTYTAEPIRDVPAHSDDSWVGSESAKPINNKTLNYPPFVWGLEGVAALGYDSGAVDFSLGTRLSYPILTVPIEDIEERNYMGNSGTKDRGYGTALTYYGFRDNFLTGFDALTPGVYARLKFPKLHESFFLEYALDFRKLTIDTGYDRYNSLDTRKRYDLADQKVHSLRAGLEDKNIEVFLGLVVTQNSLTDLGKQSKFETPAHVMLGLNWLF